MSQLFSGKDIGNTQWHRHHYIKSKALTLIKGKCLLDVLKDNEVITSYNSIMERSDKPPLQKGGLGDR